MRPSQTRRDRQLLGGELVEVVSPRTNTAAVTPAENLLAAISLAEPFSLEIAATSRARWFIVRTATPAMRRHLSEQLAVAYPQADVRPLDLQRHPGLDPAVPGPNEQLAACGLALRAPGYLPLRTFTDLELSGDRAPQADPVLGLMSAIGSVPERWRGLTQLVLRPAPDDWCAGYLRLAVEHPLAGERGERPSLTNILLMAGLLALGCVLFQGYQWYLDADWLRLGLLTGGLPLGGSGAVAGIRHLTRQRIYDMQLVKDKVSRIAYTAEVRQAVFAPMDVEAALVEEQLRRVAAAYRQFNLAAGNGFVARRLRRDRADLRLLEPLGATSVLNMRELAAMWHLPQAQADTVLVERTGPRRFLPVPFALTRGCRIGLSRHQGREIPVFLPDDLLRRHLLLVAKTRRGKSTLLQAVATYVLAWPVAAASERPALVIVDPHRDLVRAVLSRIPPERRSDVVYLDVADQVRPFGLNLLDVGLGWSRDKAVANTLTIFQREFDEYWGPRMEDAFRFALLTLFEANESMFAADSVGGRARQHTVLHVPPLLADPAFRRTVLVGVSDPIVKAWWSGYFDLLDRRLQLEISNPVATKVQRFAGSKAARSIVGQPRSTIDPASWIQSHAVVLIDTAKNEVGENTAALVGGSLLNLIGLAIGDQGLLEPGHRRALTVMVDEMHLMPGADYEAFLAELSKFGASIVLSTQSLARLEVLDRDHVRALKSTIFANIDGLFVFNVSAEDARYLIHELGSGLTEEDLGSLGDYDCYARLQTGGQPLPVFSVHLDPPSAGDHAAAARLAAASAGLYGRDIAAVEADLRSALARIEQCHPRPGNVPGIGTGTLRDGAPSTHAERQRQRTRNRDEKDRSRKDQPAAAQPPLPLDPVVQESPPAPEDAPAGPNEGGEGKERPL